MLIEIQSLNVIVKMDTSKTVRIVTNVINVILLNVELV